MNREDIRKLLGGYATGTLTAAEQEALFAGALEDQELFDALAREQPLRDALGDPAARAQLLAALEDAVPRRLAPSPWVVWPAAAAVSACAVLLLWPALNIGRPAAGVTALFVAPAGVPVRAAPPETVFPAALSRELGLACTILRQMPDGKWQKTTSDRLRTGDAVRLRIVPSKDGYIRVFRMTGSVLRTLAQVRLVRDKALELDIPKVAEPGRGDLLVEFSRREQAPETLSAARVELTRAAVRATAPANRPGGPEQEVTLRIVLTYR